MQSGCPVGARCAYVRDSIECLERVEVYYRRQADFCWARKRNKKRDADIESTATKMPPPIIQGADWLGPMRTDARETHAFNAGAIAQWIMKDDEKQTVGAMAKFYPSALRRLMGVIDKALKLQPPEMEQCAGENCARSGGRACLTCTRDPALKVERTDKLQEKKKEQPNG
jgi:hypothetical protein